MFEIKCTKCEEVITFRQGVNDESQISIQGQVEVLYDADIYISCNCGNNIVIEKRYY